MTRPPASASNWRVTMLPESSEARKGDRGGAVDEEGPDGSIRPMGTFNLAASF